MHSFLGFYCVFFDQWFNLQTLALEHCTLQRSLGIIISFFEIQAKLFIDFCRLVSLEVVSSYVDEYKTRENKKY